MHQQYFSYARIRIVPDKSQRVNVPLYYRLISVAWTYRLLGSLETTNGTSHWILTYRRCRRRGLPNLWTLLRLWKSLPLKRCSIHCRVTRPSRSRTRSCSRSSWRENAASENCRRNVERFMASITRSRGARSADGRRHVLDSVVEIRDIKLVGERERLSWLAKGVDCRGGLRVCFSAG